LPARRVPFPIWHFSALPTLSAFRETCQRPIDKWIYVVSEKQISQSNHLHFLSFRVPS
jgi:hypothetical protein